MQEIKLEFSDLLILHLINININEHEMPPAQRDLFDNSSKDGGLFNAFLTKNKVSKIYAIPLTGNSSLDRIINRLKTVQALDNRGREGGRHRAYWLSDFGYRLVQRLDSDWRKWPTTLPVTIADVRPAADFSRAEIFSS